MKHRIILICCLAAVGLFVAGGAEAQACQPGHWQDCLALEQQCVQCGSSCYDADSGPCWEAQACTQGYYVYDRWLEYKGVNCDSTGASVCYFVNAYTEFEVDSMRTETWERRECYDGSSGIFVTLAGYSTSYPGTAWLKSGYCGGPSTNPSPKIHACI